MNYPPPYPEPLHEDKGLNTQFWFSLGFHTNDYPHTLELSDGSTIRVWRNTIRDRTGRFDGYILTYQKQMLTVRTRALAASIVLVALIADGAQFEPIPKPYG